MSGATPYDAGTPADARKQLWRLERDHSRKKVNSLEYRKHRRRLFRLAIQEKSTAVLLEGQEP